MIARLLDPLLNLGGWEAYTLVGALVFAEASILIGFVFPGETAVILGGVVASRNHINIVILIVIVVACATDFARVARAPVQWVPGGHSWMLARPQGQSDILLHLATGQEFMADVEKRWRQFTSRDHTLRAVNA